MVWWNSHREDRKSCACVGGRQAVTLGNRIVWGLEKAVKQVLIRERCQSCGYVKNHAKQRKQLVQRPKEEDGHCIHSLTGFLGIAQQLAQARCRMQHATFANCTYLCITGIIFITSSYHLYYYLIIFILVNFSFYLNTCIFNWKYIFPYNIFCLWSLSQFIPDPLHPPRDIPCLSLSE